MTLDELKAEVSELRYKCEELAENANDIWKETEGKDAETAYWLDGELDQIAGELSDIEDELGCC